MTPIELLTVLGVPASLYGAVEAGKAGWQRARDWWEGRGVRPDFQVLSTHVKYIMWEEYSELIKLRRLRALRRIRRLQLDRYPMAGELGQEKECTVRNFYSLPGTASKKGDHFMIDLEPNEELRAHQQHALVFGYIVPLPLTTTHPGDEMDGLDVRGPLGTGEVFIEVHLPRSRRFGNENAVRITSVHQDGTENSLQPQALTIDRSFRNTDFNRETDVLRLQVFVPPNVDAVRVRWPWRSIPVERGDTPLLAN